MFDPNSSNFGPNGGNTEDNGSREKKIFEKKSEDESMDTQFMLSDQVNCTH